MNNNKNNKKDKENNLFSFPIFYFQSFIAHIIYTYIISISLNITLIGCEILEAKYYSESSLLQCLVA